MVRSARAVVEAHLQGVASGDPEVMAKDYAANAVLLRGTERYDGRERILAYFRTVPERLGNGAVRAIRIEATDEGASVWWAVSGGPGHGTRGRDDFLVGGGMIVHQVVNLEDGDF